MDSDDTPNAAQAGESLEALGAVGELNAERLQRPPRYWFLVGFILAVLALVPLVTDLLSMPAALLVLPGAIVVVFLFASWKQPSAVRHIRLHGSMWLPFLGGVLVVGFIGGINSALYDTHGWWWIPVIAAVVLFSLGTIGGPALDRYWVRRVRNPRD
ncbi:hypothetical protein [Arthrobacter rhombi]|uniref:Uncharacterized protein n=1 Tax=Arthrobacter rhombi TaxID=71253 RepID=A0A1R4GGT3_9MICC|nr:hypothetical protein [Arthrobacter rhombi]SJM67389.1 hypothetical protein FM101_10440 [Arthrobacter rhombi]